MRIILRVAIINELITQVFQFPIISFFFQNTLNISCCLNVRDPSFVPIKNINYTVCMCVYASMQLGLHIFTMLIFLGSRGNTRDSKMYSRKHPLNLSCSLFLNKFNFDLSICHMFKNVLSFPCCNFTLHSSNTICLHMPVDSPLTIFVIIYFKHTTCLSNIPCFSRSKVLTVVLLRIQVCWHVTLVAGWMVPSVERTLHFFKGQADGFL